MLDYAAFPQQRQSLIRQKLLNEGRVVGADLAAELQVSEHTIRRDLQELAREGVCKRVYGGAVSMVKESDTFINRSVEISAEKQRIARGCARLIKPGGCVFIDAGSTNLALARALPDDLPLTAVTNSPLIAVELMRHDACEVILLGGQVQKQTGGTLGITPLSQLNNIWFDQCFPGGCAIDAEAGLTVFDYADAEFKKALVQRSNEVIIAMTAEKIPGIARYAVAQCDDIAVMVVEEGIAGEKLAAFAGRSISIIFAE